MKTYTKDEAVAVLAGGDVNAEVYGWPEEYETETSFAFVVIFKVEKVGWLTKTLLGWAVNLHRKASVPRGYTFSEYVELDALPNVGPSLPSGLARKSYCPTLEDAVDFAMSTYALEGFFDYDAMCERYREKYPEGCRTSRST